MPQWRVRQFGNCASYRVKLPEPGYMVGLIANREFGTDTV